MHKPTSQISSKARCRSVLHAKLRCWTLTLGPTFEWQDLIITGLSVKLHRTPLAHVVAERVCTGSSVVALGRGEGAMTS
jgi:hypothetical protein